MEEKEHTFNTEEKIEKICIHNFQFSPAYAEAMITDFKVVIEVVNDYKETSGAYEEKLKRKFSKISFNTNKLKIKMTRLVLLSDKIVDEARFAFYNKKEPNLSNINVKEAIKAMKEAENDFIKLLDEIDDYTDEVEKIHNKTIQCY